MTLRIVNPVGLYDPTAYGYSHVVCAPGGLVFVAGQFASDEHGHVTSPDFGAQVERSLANLGTALAAVDLSFTDVVQIRTHVVDHNADKLTVLGDHIGRIWGSRLPAQTLIGVAALALPGMLFEIDAIAVGA